MSLATWPWRLVTSLSWYAWEFVTANVGVTWDILTPTHRSDPRVVRYDTRCRTEWEVSLLSVLITLTPGTMVLATEETTPAADDHAPGGDRSRHFRLYVHAMFGRDGDDVLDGVEEMEGRMLAAMRPFDGRPEVRG